MSRTQSDINFSGWPAIANPWPLYEQVRAAGRVVWIEFIHGWMVAGFDDWAQVLTDTGGHLRPDRDFTMVPTIIVAEIRK